MKGIVVFFKKNFLHFSLILGLGEFGRPLFKVN